jgi:hypothetical protein
MVLVAQVLVVEQDNLLHNPHNCRQAHLAAGRIHTFNKKSHHEDY